MVSQVGRRFGCPNLACMSKSKHPRGPGNMGKINRVGQVFFNLTVTRDLGWIREGTKDGVQWWECLCSCGKTVKVRSGNLASGNTKSCGCWVQKNRVPELPEGEAGFRALYGRYRSCASSRKIGFELTVNEFKAFTKDPCYWCGAPPSQKCRNGNDWSIYVFNGVDRLHSNLGYTMENCVACCKTCNWAKHTMTPAEFVGWIKVLYTRIQDGKIQVTTT